MVLRDHGDLAGAESLLDEMGSLVVASADRAVVTMAEAMRAMIEALRGNFENASAGAASAANRARRWGLVLALAQADMVAALASFLSAEDRNDSVLEDFEDSASAAAMLWGVALAKRLQAERALQEGNIERARKCCATALGIADAARIVRGGLFLVLAYLDRADGLDGEEKARAALAESIDAGFAFDAIDALELLAACSADAGELDVGARLLGAAQQARAETGMPVPPVRRPLVDETTERIRHVVGADRFTQLFDEGGTLDLEAARDYVERGRGARRRPTAGWDSLTPAERRVVELIAEGRKNADIARELFVAVPTVKTHLAHIFAKLGFETRAELAAAAVRRAESS
jgi:DNA-binding CsgD family transcriptional regulator